jgi:hypothetical protein
MKLNWPAIRLRALQAGIGKELLRVHYELPQELPHSILTLLMQLNAQQDGRTVWRRGAGTVEADLSPLRIR